MKSGNINYKENKDIVLTIISRLIILLLVAIIAITIILVRKNINTKTQNEETLAKDKTINLDNVTNEEKSPYVIYNNLLCRVLYNDEVHGLQIITNDNVGEVSLGSSDNTVTADEFIYDGTADVNDKFKNEDTNYKEDVEQINLLGLNATDNTWFASWGVNYDTGYPYFTIRF